MKKTYHILLFILLLGSIACESKHEKAKAALKEGMDLMRHSRFKEALTYFDQMVSLSPQDDESYFSRACCYYNLREYDKALADYKTATELNPNNMQAFYNRGETYEAMGKVKEACTDWIKARDLGKPNISDRIKICRQWGFQ